MILDRGNARHWRVVGDLGGRERCHNVFLLLGRVGHQLVAAVPGGNYLKIGLPGKLILSKRKGLRKSYSLENSLRESIFRDDLFLYNCLQAGKTFAELLETDITSSEDLRVAIQ